MKQSKGSPVAALPETTPQRKARAAPKHKAKTYTGARNERVRQTHFESAVRRAKTSRRRQSDFAAAPERPPQSVCVAPSGIEDHRGRIPSLPDDVPRVRPRRFRRPHGLWCIYAGAVANEKLTIRARPATTLPAETCRLRSLWSSGRSSAAADLVLALQGVLGQIRSSGKPSV